MYYAFFSMSPCLLIVHFVSNLYGIPDGLVEDPIEKRHRILEIKCLYSARTMTPQAVCDELNQFFSSLVAGQVTLK